MITQLSIRDAGYIRRNRITRSNAPDMALKVLQYNCRKSAAVLDDLRHRWRCSPFHLFAIQEPPLTPRRRLLTLPGMIAVPATSCGDRSLAGLYVSEALDAVTVPTNNAWSAAIAFTYAGRHILLISAYLAPSGDLETELRHLADLFARYPNADIIICADANAHSLLWHSRSANERGRLFERFFSASFAASYQPSSYFDHLCRRNRSDGQHRRHCLLRTIATYAYRLAFGRLGRQ